VALRYTTLRRIHRQTLRRQTRSPCSVTNPRSPPSACRPSRRGVQSFGDRLHRARRGTSARLRRLRIFTPAREMQFAGHPTLGAVHALVDARHCRREQRGSRWSSKSDWLPIKSDASVRALLRSCSSRPAAPFPETRGTAPSRAELAHMLSLEETRRGSKSATVHRPGRAAPRSSSCRFAIAPALARAKTGFSGVVEKR